MRIARVAQVKENQSTNENFLLVKEKILKFKGKKGSTIPVLQAIQNVYGYLPPEILVQAAGELGLPLSDMYGVATFYAQFRFSPVGKHIIKVCHGTACHVQNAGKITDALEESLQIKDGETTDDKIFTLESVACLGCCSLAPVMMIDGETHGKLSGNEAAAIVKEIKINESK
jgi:NADH-quinone oxidoreductase subunit E